MTHKTVQRTVSANSDTLLEEFVFYLRKDRSPVKKDFPLFITFMEEFHPDSLDVAIQLWNLWEVRE